MNLDECWIPETKPCEDLTQWDKYDGELYAIFKRDWLDSCPTFMGLPVHVRHNPRWGDREEGYWHLTCCDYGKEGNGPESRNPDIRRCERIRWPRAFVENYSACKSCDDAGDACGGVYVWKARSARGKWRYKLLHEDERYLVVLEPRKSYCLLITAYHLDDDRSLKSCLREYEKNMPENA